MKKIQYKEFEGILEAEILRGVLDLYRRIFGAEKIEKVLNRLATMPDLHTAIAFSDEKIVGFKIGYQLDETRYYSWLGGVSATFRGYGIASKLMILQHDWCRKKGYKIVQTKTMNRWRDMLILNLKNGFDIVETYKDEKGIIKIILEKRLLG